MFFTLMSRFCDTQASGIGAAASDHNRKRAMNKKPLVTVLFKKFYTPKMRFTLSHLLTNWTIICVCARQFIWMQKKCENQHIFRSKSHFLTDILLVLTQFSANFIEISEILEISFQSYTVHTY